MHEDKKSGVSPDPRMDKYYDLKPDAVEDLVTADSTNSPKVDRRELRKFRKGKAGIRLPDGLKAFLIKGWFAGVVCYFFIWGMGGLLADQWDMMLVTAIALGLVMDLLQNPILRYYAEKDGANNRWMMFPRKGFISLPLNLLYAGWLVFCTATVYAVFNHVLVEATGRADAVVGVGPILFGALTAGWDLLFLQIKKIFTDARASAEGRR